MFIAYLVEQDFFVPVVGSFMQITYEVGYLRNSCAGIFPPKITAGS